MGTAFKAPKKVKSVQGFGVRQQGRTKFRGSDPKSGEFNGRYWIIFSEAEGLFQWRLDGLSGYHGPTLADVLRAIKKADRVLSGLEEIHGKGNIPKESQQALVQLLRWEHRLSEGKLTISGPMGKGEEKYYKVRETRE